MCYSRAADQWLASDLGEALQRFAKPWYRTRTLRVFRDTTSLSANPGLWTAIVKGIEQSEYFILLASPDAAASVWVDHEIRHWLASKPVSKLLIVVTDGDIRWDRQSNDFDGSSTTCIPRALFGALPEEPRWVDLRWAKGHDRLSLRTPRFRDAIADLAAPLHAVAKEELVGAEAAQFSRTRLIVRSAIITIAALASTTVIFAIQARQGPAGTGGSTAWAAAGVTFGIVAGLSLGGFVALWLYSLALPLLQTASGRARRQPGPEPPTGLPGRASSSEPPERRSIFISYRRTDEPHAPRSPQVVWLPRRRVRQRKRLLRRR
jgi:hypothetical protein